MKKLKVILLLALIFWSPNQAQDSVNSQTNISMLKNKNSTLTRYNKEIVSNDSLRFLTVDDFPVTDKMFRNLYDHNNFFEMRSGKIISMDKAWFTNDTLEQTLVFELYTDFFRMDTYLFKNSDIPPGIIKRMELYVTKDSCETCFDLVDYKQKAPFFKGFIKKSKRISKKFFISNKGFKISDLKENTLKIYGQPDHDEINDGIECCEWDFYGDDQLKYDSTNNKNIYLNGKPVAKDSFGNIILMYYRNNKLIGYIISNIIP
jgi:hypothetical protein